ncbi:MAG: hypothetical protein LBV73_00535, partial [Paraburkholderia sp.]|nr:hypothetical protein [Paraburkholderia sp.]
MINSKNVRNWFKLYAAAGLTATCALGSSGAGATEGALGRPVAGTSVLSGVGIVPPEPMTIVSLQELYIDGSIS